MSAKVKKHSGSRANIWDSVLRVPRPQAQEIKHALPLVCDLPLTEEFRSRQVAKLRKKLATLCKEHEVIPPAMAWERWQASCKLVEAQDARAAGSSGTVDPLLPCNESYVDPGLASDLERVGLANAHAQTIVAALARTSLQLVREIENFRAKVAQGKVKEDGSITVEGHKHSYDVFIGKRDKVFVLDIAMLTVNTLPAGLAQAQRASF